MTFSGRFLAGTDFSDAAQDAVERAALLAQRLDGALCLVHVLRQGTLDKLRSFLTGSMSEGLESGLVAATHTSLHAWIEERIALKALEVSSHVICGRLLPTLVEAAETFAADVIVLGARGSGLLHQLLLGSTADRMLGVTHLPLLIVRQPGKVAYRRILIPVDFSEYALPAIRLAQHLQTDAELVLLHVFEVPFEGRLNHAGVSEEIIEYYRQAAKRDATERLQALAEEAGLGQRAIQVVLDGDIVRGILDQATDKACDLIVIGRHGENRVEEWLLGSVTRDVLAETQVDVLVSVEPLQAHPENVTAITPMR